MARYSYRAIDSGGRRIAGEAQAAHVTELELRLKRDGFDLIRARPLRARKWQKPRISRRELIKFCFHLEHLISAGVPIIEALGDLRDSLLDVRFRQVISEVIDAIEGGSTLSEAMQKQPHVFDRVFVNLVKAGEASGCLPEVLQSLVKALKWQDELRAKSKKLALYPALLGSVTLAAITLTMVYLVPRMAQFIKATGRPLPDATRFLLFCGDFIARFWPILFTTLVVVCGSAIVLLRRCASARRGFDRLKLSLPVFGTLWQKIAMSRFAGIFAMMYAAGIPIIEAVRASETIVGNAAIRERLVRVGQLIDEGKSLSAAFDHAGLFPPLVIRMLRVGENTGGIDTALLHVGYFYDRDVHEAVERLQTLLEPALTLILGTILGAVMLAVLAPLYDVIAGMA